MKCCSAVEDLYSVIEAEMTGDQYGRRENVRTFVVDDKSVEDVFVTVVNVAEVARVVITSHVVSI